ncbi:GGDEF domain-containing protein [Metabacillus malikii]|uniref:Diguanylate cyclase (GGDEF)-like protein n=1 Tax=Metabacillus malikii TaxID=1504265 RepID=A0ABT9ZEG2_9BACI|nr:GGDEF domain-containing protein [Metabacillus malikii]MDQ0229968.1 diguanylate cyclase (GGDEF)-like protein [Metabacillus malikii]
MNRFIGEITEIVPKVTTTTTNQVVDKLFCENSSHQGIVVTEREIPIALITRTNFYQKLGSLYGYNLYMGRTVKLLMNRNILCVDYYSSIIDVSEKAMKRSEEQLYDYIIVTKEDKLFGVVSIRTLLITLANIQSQIASYLNPLTGLPGNHIINEKMQEALNHKEFTVLYIDIDNFKSYNDIYGFSRGDEIIQQTASILKRYINDFIGHIGGDDFLAIIYHHRYREICEQIIKDFDDCKRGFYTEKHLSQGYIMSENRAGSLEKLPLVSLSIAVISNHFYNYSSVEEIVAHATEIKKRCKKTVSSCYIDNFTALSYQLLSE